MPNKAFVSYVTNRDILQCSLYPVFLTCCSLKLFNPILRGFESIFHHFLFYKVTYLIHKHNGLIVWIRFSKLSHSIHDQKINANHEGFAFKTVT